MNRYCEVGNILNQYKEMASLDYSSLAKNLSNQIMVIWRDQPEMRQEILKLKDAAQCLSAVGNEFDGDSDDEGRGDDADW